MKVITLSKRAFESLEPLKLSREVLNTESQVYYFKSQGKPMILKKLFYQDGVTFANKLYTLEMLSSNKEKLPNSFMVPDALISVSGKIPGFVVPFMEGENLEKVLLDSNCTLEEKKYFLTKVGEILNQMKAIRDNTSLKDLFLCDLHASNFVVNRNNHEVGVVDLDSCKINGNKSSTSLFLNPLGLLNHVKGKYNIIGDKEGNYNIGYVEADENTDLYCYSMMLLSFLYGNREINCVSLDNYYRYLDYLSYVGIDDNLLDSFRNLVSNKKNSNPFHYISTINREQACRAKCIVYQKVKKNFNRF